MSETVTLLVDPAPADASGDFAATFREVDATEPAVRVGDLAGQRGDGVFETIAFVDGHAQEVGPHLARLANSARICELPEPNAAQWRQAIETVGAKLPATGEFGIKVILSRGVDRGPAPTAWITANPAADQTAVRTQGVEVVTLDRGYARDTAERAPWLLLGAKTLSYATNMAAIREAHRRGADDAVFVSSDGFVMEGPTSSVILRSGGVYATPSPSGAILHGTTQLSLFDHLAAEGRTVEYRDIRLEELLAAEAAWLVSSVRLATAITAIDGVAFPADLAETAGFNAYLLTPRD
ncbi:aminodeoxychorismate lyase [Agromyces seonyuensis]|uniref:Aminodeoxychorismate lyase n=1 Tax=Agromyces seonyuensis TaxID=2662446 RepID=A0A6I4P6Z9_9MICO|nr:aminodeoxychorismate lyase [Agromyces seonyuensis]MWB99484.1 aminodeoxychorismate lyase [Agromyces seonyuensis]